MAKLANIADLERLEDDIEEALINLIDKQADDLMIADLRRRKLHLRDAIELERAKDLAFADPCDNRVTRDECNSVLQAG